MQLVIDNATRFFTVVGAPYIAESHLDGCADDVELPPLAHPAHDLASRQQYGTAGWLQDDR